MNLKVFFFTHRALRKQNKILRERNLRQRELLRAKVLEYKVGFTDAEELYKREHSLLHEEIQHLNDLLVTK